ncbi:50S ribosomal protein L10 [Candidatus Palibaumannia cicadellinicola]|uniref:Large ribosomal subunit protein uL10 n=1 Tax=Candidatus Palibaumannia cicadellinicola TaxID=186490 RepID=A0A0K2BLH5_9GAMM|nr:50S ribosomal protein L10 [Candidatus Baumannia cicadellinicola]AKZ66032.1 LSU ribosomal protein L10p (P0) [Candidatus Baumannia cicadellinicola]
MALNLQNKKTIVTEVKKVAKIAISAVVADYRGITVNQLTELRKKCSQVDVKMLVVRNTLMRRIVENTPFECLTKTFIGPTLIAFSTKHPGTAARLFKSFAQEHTKLNIKAAAFEGAVIPALQIDKLATMPTYEEAIAKLMFTLQEASIGKLARIFVTLRDQKKLA